MTGSHPGKVVLDPLAVSAAIQSIRRHVCEHFYLAEMRDPDLKVRSKRRIFVLPHQVAMYLARQLTGASLHEIGRQFGGRSPYYAAALRQQDREDASHR